MEHSRRKQTPYLYLYALITVAAVTLRTVASFTSLNEYGYYSSVLFPISGYLTLGGVLLLLCYALLHRRDEKKRADFSGPLTYIPGAPLALCLVLLGASLFVRKAAAPLGSLALKALALLAVFGAFYFLFTVLYETKLSDLRAAFGMALTLFLILYAGYLYFDKSLPINAQTKICDQVAYVFASLFFLAETRISLGRESFPLYTALGFSASLLCSYSAIPSLLVYAAEGRVISNSANESFVTLFLFAYILCRTVLSLLWQSESATPLMQALFEDARALREQVASHGPLPFEPQPTPAAEEDGDMTEKDEETVAETESTSEDEPSRAQEDNNEENSGN